MTVRDMHNLAGGDTEIFLTWDVYAKQLDRSNKIELDAYGAYIIESILAVGEDKIECELKRQFVKE